VITAHRFNDCRSSRLNAAVEVAVSEPGNDYFLNYSMGDRVWQHALKAVTNFDADFSVVAHDDQDRTIVSAFVADFPRFGDADAEVFEAVALETRDGENGDLMAGSRFNFSEPLFELCRCLFAHHASKIVDAAE
jgi:hypothetical protein